MSYLGGYEYECPSDPSWPLCLHSRNQPEQASAIFLSRHTSRRQLATGRALVGGQKRYLNKWARSRLELADWPLALFLSLSLFSVYLFVLSRQFFLCPSFLLSHYRHKFHNTRALNMPA